MVNTTTTPEVTNKKELSVLFVNKKCMESCQLLRWVHSYRKRGGSTPPIRVVDIATLACRGIVRRLKVLPCLVTKNGKQITGLANIRKSLQFNSSRARGSTSYAVPTRSYSRGDRYRDDDMRAFDLATTAGFCRLASGTGKPKKVNTRSITEPRYTAGGMREKKVADLEQDLEALISDRNNLGISRRRL